MKKFPAILLIGCLSMLFAEVFSGASQTWFVNGWGLLITFPLYLAHVLFFLWIALKTKKISLTHLYFLGVIFALYESWITKVLWAGYMDASAPGLGTFLGLGIAEFPVLVFFWHPIMSFILPVLTFEILTKKSIIQHKNILEKTRKKTIIIVLFLLSISAFVAAGNLYNIVSANASLIGSFVLIGLFTYLSRKTNLRIFEFKKKGFIITSVYLVLLYVSSFFVLLPNRIPNTIIPFLSILVFYAVPIILFYNSKSINLKLIKPKKNTYSVKDLIKLSIIVIIGTNIACFTPVVSEWIFILTYIILSIIGILIFFISIFKIVVKRK